jgi:hypothetical protein
MTRTDERFRWRYALICGLLWGIAVTLSVSLTQPVVGLDAVALLKFMIGLSVVWLPTGLVWSVGVKLGEDVRRPRLMTALTFVLAWTVSIGVNAAPVFGHATAPGNYGRLIHLQLTDLSVYLLWVNLFYGGLYTVGYVSTRRTLRLRRHMAALRLARDEAETLLREMRLHAFRGQIRPAMLLEALEALQMAYARDVAAGEQLFDHLVAFLRVAMPALRGAVPTPSAERAVAGRLAELREALEAERFLGADQGRAGLRQHHTGGSFA